MSVRQAAISGPRTPVGSVTSVTDRPEDNSDLDESRKKDDE
jgi:hypothetical protein